MRTVAYLSMSAWRDWEIALIFAVVSACLCVQCAAQPLDLVPTCASSSNPASTGSHVAQNHFNSSGASSPLATHSASTTTSLASASAHSPSISPEMLGDLMMAHQNYIAAIGDYQQALLGRSPKGAAVLWNKLGIAYQHMDALKMARREYEKAVSLKPRYASAVNNLGTVYYGERSYGKAEKYYRKAIRLKPKVAAFYSNLGTAYFASGKYKQGIRAYREAFALDPKVFLAGALENVSEQGPVGDEIAMNYALARLYAEARMFKAAIHYLRMTYMDGFADDHKLMHDTAFVALRATPQFRLFMIEEHISGASAKSLVAGTRTAVPR